MLNFTYLKNRSLSEISGLTPSDGNIIVGDGSKWVAESGATARTSLGLAIGTNVQAYDADLTALGALAKTDGNFIVGNGTTWVAESGATARTSLGLGTIATYAGNQNLASTNSPTFASGTYNGTVDINLNADAVQYPLRLFNASAGASSKAEMLFGKSANANECCIFGFDHNAVEAYMMLAGDATTDGLVIGDTGVVGIGVSPSEKLDVAGNINATGVYKVDGTQVVGNRVVDARCDDAVNSGDATTDGVIDALRDAMITHGLIAAA